MHIYICWKIYSYTLYALCSPIHFMLPAYRPNFSEVAHTSTQNTLFLTSDKLWGCLSQPQCILIIELCLKVFLITSCQKDLVPEICNAITLYKLTVFYLPDLLMARVVYVMECSIRCSILVTNMESVFVSFYNLCRNVRKHVDRHI